MMKKQEPPAKVWLRYPGRPYAELVDEEFAAEFEIMKQEAVERCIRNLTIERAVHEAQQPRWDVAKRRARLTLASHEGISMQRRREIHQRALLKLGKLK